MSDPKPSDSLNDQTSVASGGKEPENGEEIKVESESDDEEEPDLEDSIERIKELYDELDRLETPQRKANREAKESPPNEESVRNEPASYKNPGRTYKRSTRARGGWVKEMDGEQGTLYYYEYKKDDEPAPPIDEPIDLDPGPRIELSFKKASLMFEDEWNQIKEGNPVFFELDPTGKEAINLTPSMSLY